MHPVESDYPRRHDIGQPVPLVPELKESNEFGLPVPELEESKTIEIGSPVRQQQEIGHAYPIQDIDKMSDRWPVNP